MSKFDYLSVFEASSKNFPLHGSTNAVTGRFAMTSCKEWPEYISVEVCLVVAKIQEILKGFVMAGVSITEVFNLFVSGEVALMRLVTNLRSW